jgi:hypothetical protein
MAAKKKPTTEREKRLVKQMPTAGEPVSDEKLMQIVGIRTAVQGDPREVIKKLREGGLDEHADHLEELLGKAGD